jgi:hypothetical protein
MRVLHQLITHFWQRGALTLEQAHYLVEHGFIRPWELERYAPRPAAIEEAEAEARPSARVPEELLPNELERRQEALSAPAPGRRKGKAAALPDYSLEELGRQLRAILHQRERWLPALREMAARRQTCPAAEEAAIWLRQRPVDTFRLMLLEAVRARPSLLGRLWEAVDPEPFHALLARPGVRGPVARAFAGILVAAGSGQWGRAGWVLRVPEVQTVANLLAVRRRLVPAVLWMYEKQKGLLGRALQRPARPPPSWHALGFGLVLIYNARAWRGKRAPPGFVLSRPPTAAAWTTALTLDADRVIPYCVHLFGNVPETRARPRRPRSPRPGQSDSVEIFAMPQQEVLICPREWKI